MNILIVGNGFDLSHYLPTKYDHFMAAMDAIEKWDQAKGDMGFDDLFGSLYEKESYFFSYTKAMYKTNEIKISVDQIKELKEKLQENVWYQYFSDHVKKVKTWIDFETKIGEALAFITDGLSIIKNKYTDKGLFNEAVFLIKRESSSGYYFNELKFNIFCHLKLFTKNQNYGKTAPNAVKSDIRAGNISSIFFVISNDEKYGFDDIKYFDFLQNQLENFIKIFNLYLELIASQLSPNRVFSIKGESWINPSKIYSFNYTNTYQRTHNIVDVEYLHGSHGKEQNIVLGISDLEDESLKKLKAYGFTKYHQKLFKDTDYLFLDEYKNKILQNRETVLSFKEQLKGENRGAYRNTLITQMQNIETTLNLNFLIWGHSLDVSDKEYILDLFSLNDDMDRNVRVIVYYFNSNAKFSLLNNLLAILGKDKVEHWMKKGWLKFEKNPDIAEINGITPVDLPKRDQE